MKKMLFLVLLFLLIIPFVNAKENYYVINAYDYEGETISFKELGDDFESFEDDQEALIDYLNSNKKVMDSLMVAHALEALAKNGELRIDNKERDRFIIYKDEMQLGWLDFNAESTITIHIVPGLNRNNDLIYHFTEEEKEQIANGQDSVNRLLTNYDGIKISFEKEKIVCTDVCIENVELLDKSKATSLISNPTFEGLTADFSVKFYSLNEYVTYKVTIYNPTNKYYQINIDKKFKNNDYVDIEYKIADGSKVINKNSRVDVNVTLKYNNIYGLVEGVNQSEYTFTDDMLLSLKEVKNPETKDLIIIAVILFLISLIAFLLLYKKYTAVTLMIMIIIMIPIIIHAANVIRITINLKVIIPPTCPNYKLTTEIGSFVEGKDVKAICVDGYNDNKEIYYYVDHGDSNTERYGLLLDTYYMKEDSYVKIYYDDELITTITKDNIFDYNNIQMGIFPNRNYYFYDLNEYASQSEHLRYELSEDLNTSYNKPELKKGYVYKFNGPWLASDKDKQKIDYILHYEAPHDGILNGFIKCGGNTYCTTWIYPS